MAAPRTRAPPEVTVHCHYHLVEPSLKSLQDRSRTDHGVVISFHVKKSSTIQPAATVILDNCPMVVTLSRKKGSFRTSEKIDDHNSELVLHRSDSEPFGEWNGNIHAVVESPLSERGKRAGELMDGQYVGTKRGSLHLRLNQTYLLHRPDQFDASFQGGNNQPLSLLRLPDLSSLHSARSGTMSAGNHFQAEATSSAQQTTPDYNIEAEEVGVAHSDGPNWDIHPQDEGHVLDDVTALLNQYQDDGHFVQEVTATTSSNSWLSSPQPSTSCTESQVAFPSLSPDTGFSSTLSTTQSVIGNAQHTVFELINHIVLVLPKPAQAGVARGVSDLDFVLESIRQLHHAEAEHRAKRHKH